METAPLPRPKLLVVDDNETNRRILTDLLSANDFIVAEAEDGPTALSTAATWIPDLILLDIAMPEMDGYEVCTRLKATPESRDIPVIFISALNDPEDQVEGFAVGGADYISKPIRGKEVLARIENQLRISRLQHSLRAQNSRLVEANAILYRRPASSRHFQVAMLGTASGNLPPGTLLDKKYRLDEKIGEGGFGVVYRGLHLALNRPVAVKIFRPISESNENLNVQKFSREGALACRVDHPNGVTVYDFGFAEIGIAYLVMELLSGFTLRSLLNGVQQLSLTRCADILIPTCAFLAKVHEAHIVHLDIKPENIFLHRVGDHEVIKVLDFGIAKTLLEKDRDKLDTPANQVVLAGTLHYVAPESITGKTNDSRADMYSVGVVLYEMLTGMVPFTMTGRDLVSILKKHIYDHPPSMRDLVPDIPPAVEQLVLQLLAKNPDQRPTASEFPRLFLEAAQIKWEGATAFPEHLPVPSPKPRNETPTLVFHEEEFEISLD